MFLITIFHPTHTQVTATDGDKDRPQNIVYFLTGQGIDPDNPANSKFDINRTTGEIFVLKVSSTITIARYTLLLLLPTPIQIELNGNNFHDFILRRQNVLNHIDLCEYPGANRIGRRKILFFSFGSVSDCEVKSLCVDGRKKRRNSNRWRNFPPTVVSKSGTIMEY